MSKKMVHWNNIADLFYILPTFLSTTDLKKPLIHLIYYSD